MIDHLGLTVSNYAKSKEFYSKALSGIGYSLLMEVPAAITKTTDVAGFGENNKPDFWISEASTSNSHVHVAFVVKSRAQVEAFYKLALEAGGKDNGAPGIRPHYHANYYAAFVLDFDGHNIEAVCHSPE